MGPLIGGYIGDHAGWRWIYYVLLIFSGCVYVYAVIIIPETHHATLLKRRAKSFESLLVTIVTNPNMKLKKHPYLK